MKTKPNFFKDNVPFLVFLFLFSWIIIINNELSYSESWEDFKLFPDAPFWFFIKAVFIFWFTRFIKKIIEKRIKTKDSLLINYIMFFSVGALLYLVISSIFSLIVSLIFGNFHRNYTTLFREFYLTVGSLIDFIMFGGFSLAYLYNKESIKYQKKASDYEIGKVKSEITQLKAQLNPHFLFNNLNILDQLIVEDSERASVFLNHFSELYRYSLHSADKELVTLEEELLFTEGYFKLMEEKYEGYYFLSIDKKLLEKERFVPPFCLQVLIENAITHNKGTSKNPVYIEVLEEEGIKVVNNKIPYKNSIIGNKIALVNLSKQYKLLGKKGIKINNLEKKFEVLLPYLKKRSNIN
ncbi:hypothetical protein SAMN04489761_3585 [Tenacibaculum sp. MAR_2009_124]|uniref:sensor histidine kinase n=1 Tax=Tenacibaculum sp. MAR_2009_124 TaxID=1250059 RepID=UPI0008952645|nr:histidine kinase [Tenacibaculum sp. MAR_2009_124]SEC78881.1 hypothetical protein SAMN04489761_3585 [Tenacibaculum sp. MAR_2009_124]